MQLLQRHIKKIVLIFTCLILLATTVLVGYKGAKIDMIFSDGITENNLLQRPFIPHDIEIQAIHTHLLKWPLALFENAIGFTFLHHALVSIFLILAMNIWLGYLIYRFSKRNLITTSIAILLLASIEVLAGFNANEGTLSMIQNRNIEIPMVISILLFLFARRNLISVKIVLVTLLVSIIFVTDQLLFFATGVGVALYLAWTLMRTKPKRVRDIENLPLYLVMASAAIVSKVIVVGFNTLGIANFYERSNTSLTYASSFKDLFGNILDYIGKIFDVFGAGFFDRKIFEGPAYAISIFALGISVWLIVKFIASVKTKRVISVEQKTISFLLISYFFAMLIFTIIIPRELAGRYFAFLPATGLLLFASYFSSLKFKVNKRSTLIILATLLILAGFFLYTAKVANHVYYNQKFESLSERLGDSSKLIKNLRDNNVTVYVDQDYWRNQIIKQQYDEKTGKSLAIPSVYCGTNIVDKQFSRKSWAVQNGSNVAIRVKECDGLTVTKSFGLPNKTVYLSEDEKDALYIYARDIRNSFDLKEYASGFVKP